MGTYQDLATYTDCVTPTGRKLHIARIYGGDIDVLCHYGNNAPGRRPIILRREPDLDNDRLVYCDGCAEAYATS